ncbi:MAG: DNA adenine methylase [Oscillospiraceae bacterium]|nr:DNA adenine methylase [Oscillospiraceae bacterium]
MNAVIKYPGSKWSIAKWIIDFFPQHHSYLEPFFGSGAVLFTKKRSAIETVNDLDGDVVNFFDWIKKDTEKLARAIYWIPYSREVYDRACEARHMETDSFQRACDFCVRMMQGHGFRTNGGKVGWKNDVQGREAAYAAIGWCKMPEVILETAERLRGVQIENRPAVEVISRFNYANVLIYADPPYLLSTRHGKQYKCEMTDADHEELLEALKVHRGPVLLSGYDSDLYNTTLRGWYRKEISTMAQTAAKRREVLWMNYEPPCQQLEMEDTT